MYVFVFGTIAIILIIPAISAPLFNTYRSTPSTLQNYGPAPTLLGLTGWINSQPLNLSSLHGKVVLIDFWTYSCINCIRTIPYLNAWESKYGSGGLVIIGVHTPEFAFEMNHTNVVNAVQKFGIKYAVAQDNNYSTWNAYNNHYWPAHYLIDANGDVRSVQFGEGNYNQTEQEIQELLREAGYNPPSGNVSVNSGVDLSLIGSPEIYVGYSTARFPIGNPQGFSPNSVVNYSIVNITKVNAAYFYGSWLNEPDSMVSVNNSRLLLVYNSKYVNVVASGNSSITIKVDNNPENQSYLGGDVRLVEAEPVSNITAPRLYNIIAGTDYGTHLLEIDAKPGFRIYTFTFG